jgi:hypothetical protein
MKIRFLFVALLAVNACALRAEEIFDGLQFSPKSSGWSTKRLLDGKNDWGVQAVFEATNKEKEVGLTVIRHVGRNGEAATVDKVKLDRLAPFFLFDRKNVVTNCTMELWGGTYPALKIHGEMPNTTIVIRCAYLQMEGAVLEIMVSSPAHLEERQNEAFTAIVRSPPAK